MTSTIQLKQNSPSAMPGLRKMALASVVSLSAAAFVPAELGAPMVVAVSVAAGMVALVLAKMQASRLRKIQQARLQKRAEEQTNLQHFAAALVQAQQQKQGFILPEHDMRTDDQRAAPDLQVDLNEAHSGLSSKLEAPETEFCAVKVTHPHASSMVH